MNDSPLHFTLRQAQGHFTHPRTWIGIGLVGGLVGLVGPFSTFEYLPLLPRLLYWLGIAAGSYAIGYCIGHIFEAWLGRRPLWRYFAFTGLLPGVPIALFVFAINHLAFGGGHVALIGLLHLLVYCPLIALGVTMVAYLFERRHMAAEPDPSPTQPALLARLPHSIRGRLLHLAVADHYVDVTTHLGHALVLMRLSDAMAETAPVVGLQVHRSHWVACDAVRRSLRQGGKPLLELENGTLVPVSRTHRPAARAAGLLVR